MRILIFAILTVMILGCQDNRASSNSDVNSNAPSSIRVGQTIDEASAIMAPLGDGSTLLSIGALDPDLSMKMWATDSGIVIAVYSKSQSTITSLSFNLSDERPKGIRTTFDFEVSSFEPSTGNLSLIVPNKAMHRSR